ncbi:Ribose import binding protein RbsB [Baekduia alba]|uniref:sugar ABC transporter substrate-binding protein n=1 Tax=Baekduia alba TaxID=2997333 RepID=UPI00234110F2|nr:sugar ABC transporter substrate-binding protein [Baekduia alba]WCB94914.1 Ribose import binding protein RbsB [Baekduia alba]
MAAKDIRLAFFTDALDNKYVLNATNAAKKVAAEEGVKMDVLSADWNPGTQLTQVQDAVSSHKYDALVVEAVDGDVVCKALKDAAKTGMPVIVFDVPICGDYAKLYTDGMVAFSGYDTVAAGRYLVQGLAQGIKEKGLTGKVPVGYVTGPQAVAISRVFDKTVKDELKKFPNLDLVATVNGQWDPAKAYTATQDLIQSHPEIRGVMYTEDAMSAGAGTKALAEAGALGKTVVAGMGGTQQAFDLIKTGEMSSTVMLLGETEAANGAKLAILHLEGKPLTAVPGYNPKTKAYNMFDDPMFGGRGPLIFKADVTKYKPQWSF